MQNRISKAWVFIINHLIILFWGGYLVACFHLIVEQIVHKPVLCYFFALMFSVLFFAFSIFLSKFLFNKYGITNLINTIKTFLLRKIPFVFFLFVLPLLIRIALLSLFRTPIYGDPGVYIDISKEIVFDGVVSRNADYSSNFPHLFWFGMFLVPVARLSCFGDWVFQVYVSLILVFNALLVYGISKRLLKSKGRALLAALMYSYLPSQLFSGLIVTHEYAFTFFVLAAVYVYTKKKTLFSWVAICLLLSIARLVNSAGFVVFIALFCCVFFVRNKSISIVKRFVPVILMVLIFFSVSFCANTIQKNMTKGDIDLSQTSVEWQLYIGANTETEGRYSAQDINKINNVVEESSTVAEAKAELRKLVLDRWKNTVKNPVLLMTFLLNKFCNVWSGTHYSIELVGHYVSGGTGHKIILALMLFNNLIYSSLISIALYGSWKKRKESDVDVLIFLKTAIIGTVCMLLLTETMNKYSLTMLGPIILLMGYYLVNTQCLNRKLTKNYPD